MTVHVPSDYEALSKVMKQGGLLVFPTETVYGIGADARSDVSCRRIYEAKGRESDNPLIVHVDSMETMSRFAHTEEVEMMPELEKLWPGPLTVIMRNIEKYLIDYDIDIKNLSLSHMSSHHFMVARSPNHWCASSWAITRSTMISYSTWNSSITSEAPFIASRSDWLPIMIPTVGITDYDLRL